MTGFDGIASAPFPEEVRKVLAEPVDENEVEVKPDGIVYLPGVWWRRKLTKAFGAGGWGIAQRQPARVMGDLVIYPGALYCHGRFVADAVGECAYYANNPNMSYASCLEGAKTDAISRCAKDLGMGSELWDAAWRERWLEKFTTKVWDKEAKKGKGAYKFKRKDAHHRKVNELDLMAGAGGAAPSTPAPGSSAADAAESSPTPPTATTATAAESATPAPLGDSGEAASAEEQAEVAAQFKRLEFRKGGIRMWLEGLFGIDCQRGEPRAWLGRLSQLQAEDAVYLLKLLEPGDMPDRLGSVYLQGLDNLRSNGRVLPKDQS
jgi:hypothetical protein